ncbi:MAG: hypothetical protein QY309_15610 [Cyclobacteriaceae bacterium]|nr:MAG: hypothetical protein QY309_15610 [Cyclobacteriaceae bacterium]
MDAKKRILATLVGFVVFFLLGWLFYGFLLMGFYAENAGSATNVMRAETDMVWWALIVGNVFRRISSCTSSASGLTSPRLAVVFLQA